MIRKIIQIDEEKCNGCGLCANACHEGAIAMIDGKAKLIRDDYCDGLGDCLPSCPVNAISFVEREALAYNEEEVQKHMENKKQAIHPLPCGCPGTKSQSLQRTAAPVPAVQPLAQGFQPMQSELNQWPVQIKLVPVNAPYFSNANLLIAADCTAYAYRDFHGRFIRNHVTLIGCPKLDSGDYSEKLTEILRSNDIKSVTIVKMEVPCCNGIEIAAKEALKNCGKMIPWQVHTVTIDGEIRE